MCNQLTCGSHGIIYSCQIKSRLLYYRSNFCVCHTLQWREGVHFSTLDFLTSWWGGDRWAHARGRGDTDDVWERGGPPRHNIFILTS